MLSNALWRWTRWIRVLTKFLLGAGKFSISFFACLTHGFAKRLRQNSPRASSAKPKWPPTPNSLGPDLWYTEISVYPEHTYRRAFRVDQRCCGGLELMARQNLVRIVKITDKEIFHSRKFLVYLKNLKKGGICDHWNFDESLPILLKQTKSLEQVLVLCIFQVRS